MFLVSIYFHAVVYIAYLFATSQGKRSGNEYGNARVAVFIEELKGMSS